MNFYFNLSLGICAEESWVIDHLLNNEEDIYDWEEAYNGLHSCREYYGWFDCEVSNTIYEQVGKYYGKY